MNRVRANKRVLIAASICLVIGMAPPIGFIAAEGGHSALLAGDLRALLAMVLFFVFTSVVLAFFLLAVYGVVVLGWLRIRDEAGEANAFADDNTVGDPEAGERKLHDYLTAITSMEARIGMLQRSAPYTPPDQRLPADAQPPRASLTTQGRRLVGSVLVLGVVAGVALGLMHGIDLRELPEPAYGYQPVMVARLAVCGLLGLVTAMPVAVFLAAFHLRITEPHDAGADRPEAA